MCIRDAGQRARQLVELRLRLLAADGKEELLLGREVAVDEADADTRFGRDGGQVRTEPGRGEGTAGAPQDALADGCRVCSRGLARRLGRHGLGGHPATSAMNIHSFWP